MDPMAAIKQTFFQECEEQLGELESGLLAIQDGDNDLETVNAVFRAVHSIKGGAGAFNLDELVQFAHAFENVLDHIRAGRLVATADVVRMLLRASDLLADLVRAARDDTGSDSTRRQALTLELHALDPNRAEKTLEQAASDESPEDVFQAVPISIDNFSFEAPVKEIRYRIRFIPKPDLYAKANEAAVLIRELGRLGELTVSCDSSHLPLLDELDPEGSYLGWSIELLTEEDKSLIQEIFEFVEGDCELAIEPESAVPPCQDKLSDIPIEEVANREEVEAANSLETLDVQDHLTGNQAEKSQLLSTAGSSPVASTSSQVLVKENTKSQATIRVDLDRVDRLINLVGELVINQAMLAQQTLEAGLTRASGVATGLNELEQLTREIQDSVMAIRAQPVKSVFQRMPRLVREVAAMTGKSVKLTMDGENTEVDKTVIERLADPLTHMIRNAIDHGLESPERRIAAGKPEEGAVHLSALHRSGRIVIEVSDDGGGIDRPKVKALAAARGLVAADAQLSDEETDNLIFLPGFSTASTVSDISGRGVGMDVVRRSIQALGGRISIRSRPRLGSTFTMSLPLTLAVLDGMVVKVAEETLVVPLTAIIETLQPKGGAVNGFIGNSRVIAIRDQFIPLIDVGKELQFRGEKPDPCTGVVLLVESEGHVRSALLVDAILGQRQVVIKSLEANYRHVQGIAAATILGDGQVALILDVDAVVFHSRETATNGFDSLIAEAS